MAEINHVQRAYFAWNVLIDFSKKRETITYKELALQIQIHHRPIRFVLDIIYDYCEFNRLPRITILVFNKKTKLPGQGFTDYSIDTIEDDLAEVFNFNWNLIENPFEFAKDGRFEKELIEQIIKSPEGSADIYVKVKSRGIVQQLFRKALVEIYEGTCAICGFSFVEALEAAHIIPYALCNSNQRLDVTNGLLMCSIHHKFFDIGLITINQDYIVEYEEIYGGMDYYSEIDKKLSFDLNGKRIFLPKNFNHYPNRNWLKFRKEL